MNIVKISYILKQGKIIDTSNKNKILTKKKKIIHKNQGIYKGLVLHQAYNDYYNKYIYQVPKMEEMYYVNPVNKENYIKALKKQIEDKRIKENENKKSRGFS